MLRGIGDRRHLPEPVQQFEFVPTSYPDSGYAIAHFDSHPAPDSAPDLDA